MTIGDIEDGVGMSEETLYSRYGIEITDPINEEVAIILHGDLFAAYDVGYDLHHVIADIKYIIREEIY